MHFGAKILYGLMRALSALPLSFHYKCFGFLTWLMRDVMRYRRDLVMVNLSRSFPELKYKELKPIMKRFYQHFGDIFAEAVWFGGCKNPERLKKAHLVEFTNSEIVEKAFDECPGVVILDSHAGNWELLGGYECYDYKNSTIDRIGHDNIVVVYKALTSKMWDDVMRLNRCAPVMKEGFNGYISSTEILRYAIKNKDSKKVYVFPTDQCPYKNSTADDSVMFMNQKTKTMLGGASIAHKFGFAVFYMNMVQTSRGHNEWSFTEICRDASTMTPHDIMQEFYKLLEQDIKKVPWNYLWTHNRWKK